MGDVKDLTAAKAERARLQAGLVRLEAERAKAGAPISAFAIAEDEAVSTAFAAARAKWLHGGRVGPQPVRDDFIPAATQRVLNGRIEVEKILPVLEKLDAEILETRRKLDEAHGGVVDAAARQKAADFEALAGRAKMLREELVQIEAELAAGYYHFVEQSDHHFEKTGRRNPSLSSPTQAALSGFDKEVADIRNVPMPDRQMLVKHRNDFAQLQE